VLLFGEPFLISHMRLQSRIIRVNTDR
jgi:hypothetical protein